MFNRFNKFQAAAAFGPTLSRRSSVHSYTNSTSSADLSSITSVSSAIASATRPTPLSSSDGTVYLPSTTISGDLTVTGKVIRNRGRAEVAAGGKLTLLDGENTLHGDLVVESLKQATKATRVRRFWVRLLKVSGNFSAEETGAVSASIYSFTPSSFKSSGDISLKSLSKAKKGEVTFFSVTLTLVLFFVKCYSQRWFCFGLQRRDDDEGSVNNGEIN
ncbi:AMP_1a_G0000120.mRNA.1.CDS.1 [Saccharomyces cerevisiae]|nr:AMP_1a_G0000120.mRNA.1.CDS.1 [Saccharomyces cerevisiae]CAI6466246.1 AMP_1a_G0000120.mRNA.1.CDS.1 [Saccharomyces cerevisiae]